MYRDHSVPETEWKPWHNINNTIRHTCGHLTTQAGGYTKHLLDRLRNGLCYQCWKQETARQNTLQGEPHNSGASHDNWLATSGR